MDQQLNRDDFFSPRQEKLFGLQPKSELILETIV
ncbi:hypothetical protein Bhyg_00800 [Pseudolycoriella hygida]|uniref:Uncharacterized protein n=1 Tax=Pseudolycoriella hygida TaxID=35572 RepID=A0A9Q0S685_9DIPT|nr:hypothetical protein Bhyg_00800 [Pseudolycoriella hygida]